MIFKSVFHHLTTLKEVVGNQKFSFALTGSAGMGVAQRIGLPFVQEVIACTAAVRRLIPETTTAVELGGEDAKITYFGDAPEQRMNGVCAGGTGSFIDHMASLLSTDPLGLNDLAAKGKRIYAIASRCGVFAKTDIQALMNDGAEKADIALSVLQAVVNQTIGNLAQGRPITGKVAFLGGPLHFLPELKKRFIETLKLEPKDVVEVDSGNYFVAMGAALTDEARTIDVGELEECINAADDKTSDTSKTADFTLFDSRADYEIFKERHDKHRVKRTELSEYIGAIYIGIDAGSTTTKLVAISEEKEILYTLYGSNQGSPLKSVVEALKKFYEVMPRDTYIAGAMTTGYGEGIVKAALHADGGEVETFAHLRAAQEFCPDVSFVLDIGGQDMKCFFVKDGTVGNITLNEACSAGCGSFIQNFAEGLHMTTADFAGKAIDAKAPVDLGTRCTVFMNSKVKQAQKDGAEVADISAGIAYSVVKNALFKVMQLKDVNLLGYNIVVQGGTFYNDAVLRSLEKLIGKEVIRPDIAGLMGAYGAAILAKEMKLSKSALLSAEELGDFKTETSSYRCAKCGNKCLITMQEFPNGEKYFTGNRCERGIGGVKSTDTTPNIYEFKYQRAFNYYKSPLKPRRGKLGIPRTLNMYEDYPFWFTVFDKLGYGVVLSGKSSPELFYKGMATIPSDSLCYPAKLAHGHIADLAERGIKTIFYPCEPYNMPDEKHPEANNFNCPIVASYAENIRINMDILREKEVRFIQPFLPINNRKRMIERFYEEFGKLEGITKKEITAAIDAGYAEIENYRQAVRDYGEEILERLERTGEHAILLAGRPYHIDPEINHGIADMIQSYKLPILSEDAVYHLPVKAKGGLNVVNQWSYHARLYHAAQFVVEHPNITMIQLSSFGCGLDAITTTQVKDILEAHDHIYTMIKLDEVSNLGAARIRLRSLIAALARRETPTYKDLPVVNRPRFTAAAKATHTILAPQMAPIHFDLFKTALRKHGYNVVIPPLPDKAAIDVGLRYVHNDMCYPTIVVVGQLISAIQSGICDPDHTSIALFQTCGACRATNYLGVLRKALKDAGYPQVAVFAVRGLPDEVDEFEFTREMMVDAVKAAIYGDLLMNVKNRMMPYEMVKGSTEQLLDKWMTRAKAEIEQGGYRKFSRLVKDIVRDFDNITIDESEWKPKVGVVGEILVKYHPVANNDLEKVLMNEGAEVVMPDFVDFFLYAAYDSIAKHKILDGSYKDKMFSRIFISIIEFFRRPMRKALEDSKHFRAPKSIDHTAALAARHVSLANMAGEGWFLTGEMVKLIEEDVLNVVCLQPFGCLPNHITGKGVMHDLRKSYEGANITAIDCDAGSSEVNQLNRLKLMLAVAKERSPKTAEEKKLHKNIRA